MDVGGPIVDETAYYVRDMTTVRDVLASELGIEVGEREVADVRDMAIRQWAPSFTKAIIWHFLEPDKERTQAVYRAVINRIFAGCEDLILMPGVDKVIPGLAKKYTLALAANQPSSMRERLERTGLMKYFKSTLLSDDLGLHKPDVRFFLTICERIGFDPEECCMVGDRLGSDIYPANLLGIRTVWMRVGPHAMQHPRVPEDVPDAIISEMTELPPILEKWEKDAGR
jgi:HAD superfamily hydrolase (TIGR01509 family)